MEEQSKNNLKNTFNPSSSMDESSETLMSRFSNWITTTPNYAAIPVAPSIIIVTGICCYMWGFHRGKKSNPRPILTRSLSMGVLHGGKLALQRLLDSHKAQADMSTLEMATKELNDLLAKEQPNFKIIQSIVAKLEMSGKENEAVKMLKEALKKAQDGGEHHEAYEIEMLLVEMLIYQGNYEDARSCKCLDEELISDARRPLYKAIIKILDNKIGYAEKDWKNFQDLRSQVSFGIHEEELYEVATDFDEFKRHVNALKDEIKNAHKTK